MAEKEKVKLQWSDIWQLTCEKGRQVWRADMSHFSKPATSPGGDEIFTLLKETCSFDKKNNPNSADLIFRGESGNKNEIPQWLDQSTNFTSTLSRKVTRAAFAGIKYFESIQDEDGHWPGDYGGPLFLLPALIITSHLTDTEFSLEKRAMMRIYMQNHQNDDGGWGLHIEGGSTMFGTVLQYCALRILGDHSDESHLVKARSWIKQNGGPQGIPSWGKFFLSILGVYDWDGCNSLMPEMWLLPKWLPVHPWRYWCHARMVYLPMAYCYGHRIKASDSNFLIELREELYDGNYYKIDWKKCRNSISAEDSFYKSAPLLKWLFKGLNFYERFHHTGIRRKAQQFILEYVNAEDEQTSYIDIGPVNQIINSIVVWHAYGKESEQFNQHVVRWDDYLWVAEDGMKMNGYNGSQLWDTAFATQALLENSANLVDDDTVLSAYQYIDESQIKEEVSNRDRFFRHPSVGGWPFSTIDHGWPISDCTAEGLKAVIACHASDFSDEIENKIPIDRLSRAVDLMLSFQNKDGGWATYENTRSGKFLELLNPSEVFGKIMIDYSWVECTSACMTALKAFNEIDSYKSEEIEAALQNGERFILSNQRNDGSWIGSWAVCFTYGTWFGLEALSALGRKYDNSEACAKACDFLINQQNEDGGWGESYLSCVKSEYVAENSQVVNTSWALLSLMKAQAPYTDEINRGIQYLIKQQKSDGDWPQEGIKGVFNQNCMITYTSYRNVFPIWALGRYLNQHAVELNYRGKNEY